MDVKRRFLVRSVVVTGSIAAIAALCISAGAAFAHGHHHRHAGAMKLFAPVIQPNQRQQVWNIMKSERPTLENLRGQLKSAHSALDTKLLSSGQSVDVSSEVSQLKQAQAAMIDEQVKIAMQVRGLLSQQQLSQAATLRTQLQQLHEQEKALLHQAHGGASES